MAFQVSPGINVSEIDLATVIPAVSTTEGALAGVFRWGPLEKIVLCSSQDDYVSRFGKPTNHNPETFFTGANFLDYGNALNVVRAANTTDESGVTGVLTAFANSGAVASNTGALVKNEDHYETVTFDADIEYVAKYPGAMGNSLKISVCDTANQYTRTMNLASYLTDANDASVDTATLAFAVGSNSATLTVVANDATYGSASDIASNITDDLIVGDIIESGNASIGKQYMKISAIGVPSAVGSNAQVTISLEDKYGLSTAFSTSTPTRYWEYWNNVDAAPGQSTFVTNQGNTSANDELHVVVADQDGLFTGVPGTILEVFAGLSRATDAKTDNGTANYYKTVINQNSRYVWWASDRSTAVSNTALNVASGTDGTPFTKSFINGSDGAGEGTVPIGIVTSAYDKFRSDEVDVALIMTGKSRGGTNGEQLPNYLVDNIAEYRKDCIVLCSPDYADVVNNTGLDEEQDVKTFADSLRSSSYGVCDSGYKYQYDKYNDVYRYIPLNGDVAGLCARTDLARDPWWSPAGYNRGQIKNVVRLAWNPEKAERDVIYKAGVNPVATFRGQGTVLYGDKTKLAKPSAFDRINVRRLFIVLEKAIATAAKFTLFEFNDEFTRAQFVNLVEPYLRDVQGRRGITDFQVVCDGSNNTGEVIDRNEFVGDIYIKPARSINFIQLNFVAVRTGVEFTEIVGQF